jgi:O-antigen ligase
VPLFFLAYGYLRTTRALRVFVVVLLVIAAANGIVGYVQFNLTPDQLSAWGPGYAERIKGNAGFVGSGRTFADDAGTARVRPFGLGSDAGSGGIVGVLALTGAIALVSRGRRFAYRLAAVVLAAGAIVGIVTSQGRGVIVFAIVSVVAYAILTATSQRRVASLVGLAVAGAVCFVTVSSIVKSQGSGAFRYESLSASKILTTTRTERPTPESVRRAVTLFPLGAGLGVAGPASGSSGAGENTGTQNAENAYSFLVLETGIPGAVLLIGFTLTLVLLGAMRCRLEPDPEARALLAAILAPTAGLFVLFYGGPVTPSPPTGPYLWFAGGVVSFWLITRQRDMWLGE